MCQATARRVADVPDSARRFACLLEERVVESFRVFLLLGNFKSVYVSECVGEKRKEIKGYSLKFTVLIYVLPLLECCWVVVFG